MRRHLAPIAAALAFATALPAAAETLAITGARILTAGPAGTLEPGVVVIRDGKIVSVGRGAPPAGARVIDASGAVVTPGLFATGSLLGAVEVSALGDDLSVDNPQIGAAFDIRDGLDPASTLIPIARTGGLTSAVVLPQPAGGGFAAHEHDGEISGGRLTAGGGHSALVLRHKVHRRAQVLQRVRHELQVHRIAGEFDGAYGMRAGNESQLHGVVRLGEG